MHGALIAFYFGNMQTHLEWTNEHPTVASAVKLCLEVRSWQEAHRIISTVKAILHRFKITSTSSGGIFTTVYCDGTSMEDDLRFLEHATSHLLLNSIQAANSYNITPFSTATVLNTGNISNIQNPKVSQFICDIQQYTTKFRLAKQLAKDAGCSPSETQESGAYGYGSQQMPISILGFLRMLSKDVHQCRIMEEAATGASNAFYYNLYSCYSTFARMTLTNHQPSTIQTALGASKIILHALR
ncbi:hypothetical protein K493DRAFT_320569, partial [Basidiobolus meristosporus CBS 931.73]